MRLSIRRTPARALASAAAAAVMLAVTLTPAPASAGPTTWIGPYTTLWDCEDAYADYMSTGDPRRTEACQSRYDLGTWAWWYGILG